MLAEKLERIRILSSATSARILLFFTIRLRLLQSRKGAHAKRLQGRLPAPIKRPEPTPLRELPVVEDIERVYRWNRYRVTRKALWKAARTLDGFRGVVFFSLPNAQPLYTVEFFFPGTTLFLTFLDLDEHEEHAVRLIAMGVPYDPSVTCAVLGSFLDRLDDRLSPPRAHAGDGG